MKMNHQLTFFVCDECMESLRMNEPESIATIRTSHKSSFYCEHASKSDDWHCGHQEPILVYISRYPS